jgi:muramidase (phage lysozyme)
MEVLINHCTEDYQHQVLSEKEKQLSRNNIARLILSSVLLSFVVIQPLNGLSEWSWRFLKAPTFDPNGLETNFKELNADKGFNRTLKDGDNVLSYVVTSPFGMREHPVSGEAKMHNGIDLSTPKGTPLYAIGKPRNWSIGEIFSNETIYVQCGEDARGGTIADVTSSLLKDYKFTFMHLDSCNAGSYASGAVIGTTGNSGESTTGEHLHFEVELKGQKIDPPVGFILWALQGKEPLSTLPVQEVKPFLDMIRFAEGTDKEDGYKTMFSGAKFNDFSKHPDKVNSTIFDGKVLKSAAAGAYQFMPDTWERASKATNAIDFSPPNQDRAAVFLIKERGALDLVKQEKIKQATFALCEEWASLPCFEGDTKGAYNQAVKPIGELMAVYEKSKSGKKQ